MKKLFIIVIAIVVVIFLINTLVVKSGVRTQGSQNQNSSTINTKNSNTNQTLPPKHNSPSGGGSACTMDAKACPDGSYVSRTGPNCEFSQCPTTTHVPTSTKANVGKKILLGGVYITPLKVLEDSRCPSGTECIWAGTVRVKVRLESDATTQEKDFEIGTSVDFINKKVTLQSVTPEATSTNPILEKDYIFTFSVK